MSVNLDLEINEPFQMERSLALWKKKTNTIEFDKIQQLNMMQNALNISMNLRENLKGMLDRKKTNYDSKNYFKKIINYDLSCK